MKSIRTLSLAIFVTAAKAQLDGPGLGLNVCIGVQAGKAFCAGVSLAVNTIIRCNGTAAVPGNCDDDLAGVLPIGIKQFAPCYQSSPTAGDAACSYNGIAYPDNGSPFNVATGLPATSALGSSASPGSSTPSPATSSSSAFSSSAAPKTDTVFVAASTLLVSSVAASLADNLSSITSFAGASSTDASSPKTSTTGASLPISSLLAGSLADAAISTMTPITTATTTETTTATTTIFSLTSTNIGASAGPSDITAAVSSSVSQTSSDSLPTVPVENSLAPTITSTASGNSTVPSSTESGDGAVFTGGANRVSVCWAIVALGVTVVYMP